MYFRRGVLAATVCLSSGVSANMTSKKSKAASMQGSGKDAPSCSNFKGGGSGGKGSKAGSCKGDVQTVRCGQEFEDEEVFLTENLKCDNEPIRLLGSGSVLNCNGHTIIGSSDYYDYAPTVVLEDGASITNCNFIKGYRAVLVEGEGCSTIDNVSASYTRNDAIIIRSGGTVILSDITIDNPDSDGIEVDDYYSYRDDDLLVVFNNVHVTGAHNNGICLDGNDGEFADRDIRVELYGDIQLVGSNNDNFEIYDDGYGIFDVVVYGSLTSTGSSKAGIDDYYEGSTFTFAEGSVGVVCYNTLDSDNDYYGDVAYFGDFIVENGASVTCDTGDNSDSCDLSCDDFANRATACVN